MCYMFFVFRFLFVMIHILAWAIRICAMSHRYPPRIRIY